MAWGHLNALEGPHEDPSTSMTSGGILRCGFRGEEGLRGGGMLVRIDASTLGVGSGKPLSIVTHRNDTIHFLCLRGRLRTTGMMASQPKTTHTLPAALCV